MERIPERVDSTFRYILVAAKRAEQLMRGARAKVEVANPKPAKVAPAPAPTAKPAVKPEPVSPEALPAKAKADYDLLVGAINRDKQLVDTISKELPARKKQLAQLVAADPRLTEAQLLQVDPGRGVVPRADAEVHPPGGPAQRPSARADRPADGSVLAGRRKGP